MHVLVTKTEAGACFANTLSGSPFPVSLLEHEIDFPGTYLFSVEIKAQMLECCPDAKKEQKSPSLFPVNSAA